MPKDQRRLKPERVTHDCTNCGNPVMSTRPSQHGHHYCSLPACRAAKQRFYSKQRLEKRNTSWMQFLESLVNDERHDCPVCGLVDALPGYAHPDVSGYPCAAPNPYKYPTGRGGDIVALLWPVDSRQHRVPE